MSPKDRHAELLREYRHGVDCGVRWLSPGGDYLGLCTCSRDERLLIAATGMVRLDIRDALRALTRQETP